MTNTTSNGLPDLNQKPKFDSPLPVLFSSRVRLNDDQRTQLQQAWRKVRDGRIPQEKPSLPGSSVRTHTTFNVGGMQNLTAITISDIISTRETIPLTTVLILQEEFGLDLFSKEFLRERFENYLTFIFDQAKTNASK